MQQIKHIAFTIVLAVFSFTFNGCNTEAPSVSAHESEDDPEQNMPHDFPSKFKSPALQVLVDSAHVVGGILVYNPQSDSYFTNDLVRIDEGYLPASTFKIPNSIIGLELGILADRNHVFKWDSVPRYMSRWDHDLTLQQAYHASCVPCYQELAREIGAEQMVAGIANIGYGNLTFHPDSLDLFWLVGSSRISQMQQIDFLERLYSEELNLAPSTFREMKAIMVIEETSEYTFSGKTGWATTPENKDFGWFVGYLEVGDSVYYVATNVEADEHDDLAALQLGRQHISLEAFRTLGFIDSIPR
jgi:beta-lactamase class D